MNVSASSPIRQDTSLVSERLNRHRFCISLDEAALCEALKQEVGDPAFCETLITTRPHLFYDGNRDRGANGGRGARKLDG